MTTLPRAGGSTLNTADMRAPDLAIWASADVRAPARRLQGPGQICVPRPGGSTAPEQICVPRRFACPGPEAPLILAG